MKFLPRITRRFPDELEADFHSDMGKEKRRAAREASIAAAMLFLVFGTIDIIIRSSDNLFFVSIIRTFAFCTAASVIYMSVKRKEYFLKHYTPIIIFEYIILGLSIEAIRWIATPAILSGNMYHEGLILVSFAVYTTTYLSPGYSILTGSILILSQLAVSIIIQENAGSENVRTLLRNFFFLFGANVIGLISKNMMDRYARAGFMLKQNLLNDIEDRKILEEKLRNMATLDMLTRLYNRWRFRELAEHEYKRHMRSRKSLCIMMIDLDHFKRINDTFGHAAGDEVLKLFANICRETFRESDIVGRYGGEEFVVLLPETTILTGIDTAERFRENFEKAVLKNGEFTIKTTVSIGISRYIVDDQSIDDCICRADEALFLAKKAGRNIVKSDIHSLRETAQS